MKRTTAFVSWALVLLVWCVLSYTGVITPLFLPKPGDVGTAFVNLLTCATKNPWVDVCLWPNLFSTLRDVVISFFVGSATGLALGTAMGNFVQAEKLLSPPVNFLRAIPVTALASVFMIAFGFERMRIAMAVVGTALVMTIGVWEGIKNAPREIVDAAQLDGADTFQMIRYITWYLALPFTYANAKVSLSLCLVLVIVGEMFVGGKYGLGRVIWDAQYSYNIPLAWAGIILLGLVGVGINKMLDALRPRIIFWE